MGLPGRVFGRFDVRGTHRDRQTDGLRSTASTALSVSLHGRRRCILHLLSLQAQHCV